MDDKQLTNQQSLDLISSMIANTRKNFNRTGGMMFVIWGYTAVAVALTVYLCVRLTGNPTFYWLWFALPVISGAFTWIHLRNHPQGITTYLDRVVSNVWTGFQVACYCAVAAFMIAMIARGAALMNLLLLIGVTSSMATAITGLIIKFRLMTVGGFAGIPLSLLLPLFNDLDQTLLLAAIYLLAMAIPGSVLNWRERKEPIEIKRHAKRKYNAANKGRAELEGHAEFERHV